MARPRFVSPLLQRYPPHFAGLSRVQQLVWMHHKLSGPQLDDPHALDLHLGGGSNHLRVARMRLTEMGYLVQEDTGAHGSYRACKPDEYPAITPPISVRRMRGEG